MGSQARRRAGDGRRRAARGRGRRAPRLRAVAGSSLVGIIMAEQVAAEEELRKQEKPQCDKAKAMSIAAELFGLELEEAKVKQLESYDDVNYYLRCLDGAQYDSTHSNICLNPWRCCTAFAAVGLEGVLLFVSAGTSSRSTTEWSRTTRYSWRA
eukprot:COSAG02_NODE_1484_length_12382_cov_6.377758_4_plen_154_part_00